MWHNRRQKRPEEYSTNPNTIRARRRKARLSPFSKEVEQAKASDSKAVTRAWKQRVETDTYKMSSEDERKSILENVENEVMDRRRQKGLDADTKIGRFMHRIQNNGHSPLDPALHNGIHSPPTPMQPVAPMHAVPNRYATPGSAMPFVMSSVEGRAATEAPFAQQPLGPPPPRHIHPSGLGFYHYSPHGHEASPYGNAQAELANEAAKSANMAEQIANLEKLVKGLSDDLAVAKSTIRAQENRMEDMANRMKRFDNAVGGLVKAEGEFTIQNHKVDRAIRGIQEITEVAERIAKDMRMASAVNGIMGTPAHVNGDAASASGSEMGSGKSEMAD
ncbi:hypothetical protein PG996_007503 [Apiospora saccharicola]|uniref:Uncharacterized protein n=1 Tax=Apiospora saccharicola TaxID=335842 RepID=A0ABR1VDJ1_9PEZI